VTPSGWIEAMSPSFGNCTRRVSARNAARFDATKFSPSPIPMTMGVWWRTPTRWFGWSWWMTTKVK